MRWMIWISTCLLAILLLPNTSYAQQPNLITVEGRLEIGTPNGVALPSNTLVELSVVDASDAVSTQTLTTIADSTGAFTFEAVPQLSGNDFYVLYATYDGMRQNTQPIFAEQANFVVFFVYEVSTEPIGVEVVDGSIQIDEFAQITDGGTNLVVVMQLEVVNRGDYIIYDLESRTSLVIELPVGAFGVDEVTPESSPNLRHLLIEDGAIPIVRDTVPIIPGWPAHAIRVTYLLPYPDSAVLDQPFPFQVENLRIWVPSDAVFVESEMVALVEQAQTLSPERPTYDVYQQNVRVEPNESLIVILQGEPPASSMPSTTRSTTSANDDDSGLQQILVIVGGVLLLIFGFVVFWVIRSRQAGLADVLDRTKR